MDLNALKLMARKSLGAYASLLHPDWAPNWHHRVIANVMERVAAGDPEYRRVCIQMPPRHGKSEIISKIFPGWYMAQHPYHTVINASYGAELADEMGRYARENASSELFKTLFELEISKTTNALTKWNLTNHSRYFSTSVGAALTGLGANCLTGDMEILTDQGDVAIQQLVTEPNKYKVLSIGPNGLEWKRVVATLQNQANEIYKLTFENDQVIKATADHTFPVVGKGRVSASEIVEGDQFIQVGEALHTIPASPYSEIIVGEGADLIEVAKIEVLHGQYTVYDIEVEDNHNFFVNEINTFNCLIIDDPHKNFEDAMSQASKDRIWDWFVSTAFTRLEKDASMVIVATRWAVDDLIGRVLSTDTGWKNISFPMIATQEEKYRQKGESLWPEKFPPEKCEEIKKAVGRQVWSALYQQSPVPEGGAIFKEEYFRYYDQESLSKLYFSGIYQSWDTGVSKKSTSARSSCTTWGIVHDDSHPGGCAFYLLDVFCEQLNFPELRAKAKDLIREWEPDLVWVEEEQTGRPLIDELRLTVGTKLIPIRPKGQKDARAKAVSAVFESGRVFFPIYAPWLELYKDELLSFPFGAFLDNVDSTTQALRQMMRQEYTNARRNVRSSVPEWMGKPKVPSVFWR